MSSSTPNVSRWWLALEMRRLRKERRLAQSVVAKALGCQVPKVSLMETGQRPLQDADLEILLELFEVPDEDRQLYVEELKNTHEVGWWDGYDEATLPRWLSNFIGLEQGASRIRAYQPAVVHGLLQTRDYAGEILRGTMTNRSREECKDLVDIRLRRQRFLTGPRAPELELVLDESVLRRKVGDRATMRAQLDHVVETCHSNERIIVRVVPFDRGGASQAARGAFTILNFPLPNNPGGVYLERRSSPPISDFADDLAELYDYFQMFETLIELALSPSESLDMLASASW